MEGIRSSSIIIYNHQEEEEMLHPTEQQPYAIFCNEDERTNTFRNISSIIVYIWWFRW